MLRKCEDVIHILAHKKTHLQKNFVSAFYSCSLFITQKTLQFQSLYQESLLLSEIYFPPLFYAFNRWSAFMFNSRATFLIIAQFLQQSQLSFYCWYLPLRYLAFDTKEFSQYFCLLHLPCEYPFEHRVLIFAVNYPHRQLKKFTSLHNCLISTLL